MTVFDVIYAGMTSAYNDGKIGRVSGTSAASASVGADFSVLDSSSTDPRLVSFPNKAGALRVLLCNRGGAPGSPGTGTNWVLNPSSLTAAEYGGSFSPPAGIAGLTVANVYGAVQSPVNSDYLYIIDYDTASIYCLNLVARPTPPPAQPIYTLTRGINPVYAFNKYSSDDYTLAGVDIIAVGGYVYALFTASQDAYSGPYLNSYVCKFQPQANGTLLKVDEANWPTVGGNALSLNYAKFTRQGAASESEYLFIPAIGGMQKAGSGNGAASVVDVVDITGGTTLAKKPFSALYGTYPTSGTQDFHGLAVSQDGSTLLVLTCVYATNYSGTNWRLSRGTAEQLVNYSESSTTHSVEDLTPSAYEDNSPGYFWAVALAEGTSDSGGTAILARGFTGDTNFDSGVGLSLNPAASYFTTPKNFSSSDLYGASNVDGVINTMALCSSVGAPSILRSAIPHPVVAGHFASTADYIGHLRRKIAEENAARTK
ncbi:MAG: hypothetical protein LBI10_04130 [Deltaproteobacteria bacterium]|jgi:hypothetical protein|nr:hypothetical protein [Deltaproteobacteria bacterium]